MTKGSLHADMWKQTQRSPEEEIDLRERSENQKNWKIQKTTKKQKKHENQENQENQENLLGQSPCDIGLFFVFHAPREWCRELNLFMPQGKHAESWVLSLVFSLPVNV